MVNISLKNDSIRLILSHDSLVLSFLILMQLLISHTSPSINSSTKTEITIKIWISEAPKNASAAAITDIMII